MSKTTTVPAELIPHWTACHQNLAGSGNYPNLVKEPFLGFRPEEYDRASVKILYVGKATAGDPSREELDHTYRYNSSLFWTFAREIRDESAKTSGKTTSFAWSNVCKIGDTSGNPTYALIQDQAPLAIETLKAELRSPGLSLAVFVCDGFADKLVYTSLGIDPSALGGPEDLETKLFGNREYYSRSGMNGLPPILWVKHPQGKTKENTSAWLREAVALLKLDHSTCYPPRDERREEADSQP